MNLLSKNLRQASFNGINFSLVSSDLTFGRRTVLHEYPQRNMPYVEDLGRVARRISVTALIAGDDCNSRVKRILSAFEQLPDEDLSAKQYKLVHPWLGSIYVIPLDTPKVSWSTAYNSATLELNFLEAGEKQNPTFAVSWANKVLEKADALYESIFGDFDPQEYLDYAQDIVDGVNGAISALADTKFAKTFNLAEGLTDLATNIKSNFSDISSIKTSVLSNLGITGFKTSLRNWREDTKSITSATTTSELSSSTKAVSASYNTTKEKAVTEGTAAYEQAFRLTLIGNALGASTFVDSAYDIDSDEEVNISTDEQILELRNNTLDMLEREMLLQGIDNSDLYETLSDAYAAVYFGLTAKLTGSGKTKTVELRTSKPLLVATYEQTGSISNIDQIAKRNKVNNPLFTPVGQLILSKN